MRRSSAGFMAALCAAAVVASFGGVTAPKAFSAPQVEERQRPDSGPTDSAATFTYTKLDLDKCEIDPDSEAGWARWRCEGLTKDWPVHVTADDLRYAVSYGPNGLKEHAAEQWLGGFYRIHDVLEWVQTGEDAETRKPVATILRFFLEVGTDTPNQHEHPILVVTQLKPGAVCHVAYVDARANPNANHEARLAALRLAGSFNCEAEPEPVGPQTPGIFAE